MIYAPEEWMEDAECLRAPDPDLFFAEGEHIWTKTRAAREYCRNCGVSDECLEYALRNKIDHGIFAGLTPVERRAFRKKSA